MNLQRQPWTRVDSALGQILARDDAEDEAASRVGDGCKVVLAQERFKRLEIGIGRDDWAVSIAKEPQAHLDTAVDAGIAASPSRRLRMAPSPSRSSARRGSRRVLATPR